MKTFASPKSTWRCVGGVTWLPASCRSPRSSTWSWAWLLSHSWAPDTDASPRCPADPPARCAGFCPCASASACGAATLSEQSEGEALKAARLDGIAVSHKGRLTFFSIFFSRLLTCFTLMAFFRMTGLKAGSSSSSSLPHACTDESHEIQKSRISGGLT